MLAVQAVIQQLEPFIFEWTRDAEGSVSAEHGIGSLKQSLMHYSQSHESMELMGKIKALLDPRGTLNPGEVVSASATRQHGHAAA